MTFRSYVKEICEIWMNFMLQIIFHSQGISLCTCKYFKMEKKYELQNISGCKHFGWGVNLHLGLSFKELPVATPEKSASFPKQSRECMVKWAPGGRAKKTKQGTCLDHIKPLTTSGNLWTSVPKSWFCRSLIRGWFPPLSPCSAPIGSFICGLPKPSHQVSQVSPLLRYPVWPESLSPCCSRNTFPSNLLPVSLNHLLQ